MRAWCLGFCDFHVSVRMNVGISISCCHAKSKTAAAGVVESRTVLYYSRMKCVALRRGEAVPVAAVS
jgi:hypothetical protein